MMDGILNPADPNSKQGNLILKALRTLKGISKGPDPSQKFISSKELAELEAKQKREFAVYTL